MKMVANPAPEMQCCIYQINLNILDDAKSPQCKKYISDTQSS